MSSNTYVTTGEVMTPSPKMVHGLSTVQEAIEIMRENVISSVVVERRYDGDEYGLLVVTDIANKVIARDRSPERTNVYEVMTKPVISVDRDMDIKYACRLLGNFGISRALVTDAGDVVGIVTLRDMVLRYTKSEDDDGMNGL
ncbi:MAG: CBS domain-containing protein [Alphaproteobacteria bacterium]|nr:CBS domain-containing protein [Alphaproteobacteria bacterium]